MAQFKRRLTVAGDQAELGLAQPHIRRSGLQGCADIVAHRHDVRPDLLKTQVTAKRDKVRNIGAEAPDPKGHRVCRDLIGEGVA